MARVTHRTAPVILVVSENVPAVSQALISDVLWHFLNLFVLYIWMMF